MDAPSNSEIWVFGFFGSCPMHMIWGLVKLQKTILKKSLFKLHSAQLFSILFRNHRFMLWWKVLERCFKIWFFFFPNVKTDIYLSFFLSSFRGMYFIFMPYGSTKWKTENTIVLLGFHIMTYFKHFIKHKPLIFENSEFFLLKVVNGNEIQQTSQLNTKENLFPVSRRNVHTTITATTSA